MPEPERQRQLIDVLRQYLETAQGKEVGLRDIRAYLGIQIGSDADANLRKAMSKTLVAQRIVAPSGRKDGIYKVITQVSPVQVFKADRLRRPPFNLWFPKDFSTGMELSFAESIVLREGDLITIGGVKSAGKTQMALAFCAQNIDAHPVLMGNEYTVAVEGIYEPAPRFLARLDRMADWCTWTDAEGKDKFVLLPVRDDYPEHVEPNQINIIDWISQDADKLYDIGKVLEGIKRNLGRGIAIVALQKSEGAINPRGGQFVRDFSDVEFLLDPLGGNSHDILLTVKGVKEATKAIAGATYAYTIGEEGTKIFNFREVKKCRGCNGSGILKGHSCEECLGTKYTDK